MEPPAKEIIKNRYELLEMIGQGGQGLVFRARDQKEGRFVAVKIMMHGAARDSRWVERMAREQQAMVALAGTHAVGFIDLCKSRSGALCLVMEWLEGKDLEAYLKEREGANNPLSVPELVALMTPIIDTLEKAHAVGIVHRDLKPGNLFVVSETKGGGLRLLDFGFARTKTSERLTESGTIVGSPSYIPPEMWLGLPEGVDERADIYSLGVILYRVLSGELPFKGNDLQQKFIAATTAERPSLHALRRDLPTRIDIWVERALAVEPEDRFPNVRAFWGEFLWALGLASHPSGKPPRPEHSIDVRRVREWLETPLQALPNTFSSAWKAAASALKRWTRSTEAPRPEANGDKAPAEATPPPLPASDNAPDVRLKTEETEVSGTRPSLSAPRSNAADESIDIGEQRTLLATDESDLFDEHRSLLPEAPASRVEAEYEAEQAAAKTATPEEHSAVIEGERVSSDSLEESVELVETSTLLLEDEGEDSLVLRRAPTEPVGIKPQQGRAEKKRSKKIVPKKARRSPAKAKTTPRKAKPTSSKATRSGKKAKSTSSKATRSSKKAKSTSSKATRSSKKAKSTNSKATRSSKKAKRTDPKAGARSDSVSSASKSAKAAAPRSGKKGAPKRKH